MFCLAFQPSQALLIRSCARGQPTRIASCAAKSEEFQCLGRFRAARPNDALKLAWLTIREGMNPLLGSMQNFTVFETNDGEVVAGGQVRTGDPGEISSVVVDKALRRRGIGSALVGRLVAENSSRDLCLITITRRVSFYERYGFRVCDERELPLAMRVEMQVGKLVIAIIEPGMCVIAMVRNKDL